MPSPFGFLLPSRWAMVLYRGVATESFLLSSSPFIPFTYSLCFCHHWITHFFENVLSLTGLPATWDMGPKVWHSSTDIVGSPWTWVDVSCQPPTWSLSALNIIYCQVLWEIAGITPKERCNLLSVKLGQIKCKWMRWVFCISNSLCNQLSGWGISRNIQNLVSETRHSHRDMPG